MRLRARLADALPALLIVLAATATLAACGDDDDGGDQPSETVDTIGLVSAALEEEPRRLPSGVTVNDITFEAAWDSRIVAVIDMSFTGDKEHFAIATIFRTASEARSYLEAEAAKSKARAAEGKQCWWSALARYLEVDSNSICYGRSGTVVLEVQTGPVEKDVIDSGLVLLRALERHFDSLAEGATRRVRQVAPEPLTALLSAVPPPGPSGQAHKGFPFANRDSVLKTVKPIREVLWAFEGSDTPRLLFWTFANESEAMAAMKEFPPGDGSSGAACARASDAARRVCSQRSANVVFQVTRVTGASAPLVDAVLQEWASRLAGHVESLRSGELPRPARATATPSGTTTPTQPPATPTSTATPTRTPGPLVLRFNAGTWTFPMVIVSNSCPGAQPPVGAEFTLEYEFSEYTGDGYIYGGEIFSIEQYLPGRASPGTTVATLPRTIFGGETVSGTLVGVAALELTFIAENLAIPIYVEDYKTCQIVAE